MQCLGLKQLKEWHDFCNYAVLYTFHLLMLYSMIFHLSKAFCLKKKSYKIKMKSFIIILKTILLLLDIRDEKPIGILQRFLKSAVRNFLHTLILLQNHKDM